MKFLFPLVMLSATLAQAAAVVPEVSNVRIASRLTQVEIKYDLTGCDGIVTVDILTNGVSIGLKNVREMTGDVNTLVSAGTDRTVLWKPRASWPEADAVGSAYLTAKVRVWAANTPPDYLVVDLENPKAHRYYEIAEQVPDGVTNAVYKTSKIAFRRIHAAGQTFQMGEQSTAVGFQTGKSLDNQYLGIETVHSVSFSNDFYLTVFELTKEQYRRIKGNSALSGPFCDQADAAQLPMTPLTKMDMTGVYQGPKTSLSRFSSYTAGSVLSKFKTLTGLSRLHVPTEAEWEFACRAGNSSTFYWGGVLTKTDGVYSNDDFEQYGWCEDNADETLHPVGLKEPNAWGLYDMLGNAGETTLDLMPSCNYYKNPEYAPLNGEVSYALDPLNSYDLVGYNDWQVSGPVRGGSYWEPINGCRCASRPFPKTTWGNNYIPNSGYHIGCRIAIRLN